jgi:hypothetical protein
MGLESATVSAMNAHKRLCHCADKLMFPRGKWVDPNSGHPVRILSMNNFVEQEKRGMAMIIREALPA